MSSGSNESIGETEVALVLADEGILAQDDIPDENQQIDCFSCGENMTGLFCHACGQKNDNYRRSIWALFTEAFTSVFSLENRMWRTWMMLIVKPGMISREYSDGKRSSWTSPIRIYLALSIILFGYMSLTETQIFSIRTDIVPKATFEGPVEDLADAAVKLNPDFGFFKRQAEIDKLNQSVDFKRVDRLFKGQTRQAFVFDGNLEALGLNPTNEILISRDSWPDRSLTENLEVSSAELREQALENYREKILNAVDAYNLILSTSDDPATIIDQILEAESNNETLDLSSQIGFSRNKNIELFGNGTLSGIERDLEELGLTRDAIHTLPTEIRKGFNIGTAQINGRELSQSDIQNLVQQILRNPALLNEGISKYLPRIMFAMMPFAAIIGMIFIRGREKALLYDHLVHATYVHAVTFAFLLSLILLVQWTPLSGLIGVFFLGIAIYLPISAKNMFQRGWFKTIFASYSIAVLYGLMMIFVLTYLTAGSISQAIQAAHI